MNCCAIYICVVAPISLISFCWRLAVVVGGNCDCGVLTQHTAAHLCMKTASSLWAFHSNWPHSAYSGSHVISNRIFGKWRSHILFCMVGDCISTFFLFNCKARLPIRQKMWRNLHFPWSHSWTSIKLPQRHFDAFAVFSFISSNCAKIFNWSNSSVCVACAQASVRGWWYEAWKYMLAITVWFQNCHWMCATMQFNAFCEHRNEIWSGTCEKINSPFTSSTIPIA